MASEASQQQAGTVPPPPAWLYQAMTEGLNAAQQGNDRIPVVGRETLPPRAAPAGAAKSALPAAPKPAPPKPAQRKAPATAPTVPGPPTPPTAKNQDFDEFSKSMEESTPAAQVKKGIPIPVVDTGKKDFRADWAPTISDHLIEARVRIKAPDGDSTPIGVGATSGGVAPTTPVGTDTPASTPITGPFKPASWLAHEQELRVNRNAVRFFSIGALFVVGCAFVAGGMGAVAEGLTFAGSRNIGNGVGFVLLLPFAVLHIAGKRWAGWIVFVICALSAVVSVLGTLLLAGARPLIAHQAGLSITGIPILGLLGNLIWLAASAILFFGTPTTGRNLLGLGGILLSGGLMFTLATTDFTPKLANPIIDARASRLGDPAVGFSYDKPEGYAGYRLDEGAIGAFVLTHRRPLPSADIYLNTGQTVGFFHHLSNQGFGKEKVPPSMFALLDESEPLGEEEFEVNGATFVERRFRMAREGDLPEVVCATVCTELEDRWLHFTVLVYSARHGGTEPALQLASETMQGLLAGFDVDTPPPGLGRAPRRP